jgi:hypothetical protein
VILLDMAGFIVISNGQASAHRDGIAAGARTFGVAPAASTEGLTSEKASLIRSRG